MAKGNSLKIRPWLKEMRFIGVNGRYGMTEKPWKDFSSDELAEFWIAHDKKTRNYHLTGTLTSKYVNPLDEAPPIKPEVDNGETT